MSEFPTLVWVQCSDWEPCTLSFISSSLLLGYMYSDWGTHWVKFSDWGPVLCPSLHLHSYWVRCIVIGALTGLSLVIGALCFVLHFIFTTYYWVICKVIGGPVLCPSLHLHSYWVRWFGFSVHCTVYSSDWGPCALSSTSYSLLLCQVVWVWCSDCWGPVFCLSLHLHSFWVRWYGFGVAIVVALRLVLSFIFTLTGFGIVIGSPSFVLHFILHLFWGN